jgi:PAS domain S-box-containing protein
MNIWKALFTSGNFEPHGYCYLWKPGLVWLHVVSDSLIALAYFAIPVVLIAVLRKRRDLPFRWMFVLFGAFIIACGSTHLMEVWDLWHANYWLAGAIKAVTAALSVSTAILLVNLVPGAVGLPSAKQWIEANAALQEEVRDRREVEMNLRISEANYREQAELLDLTHDAIFVRSNDSRVLYWNRGAERLYGWTKEEARDKTTHSLLQTEFPIPLPEILSQAVSTGFWEGELIHRCRDGSRVIVSSRWMALKDEAGKPISFLESNRDITLRKRDQEKFRNLLESAPDAIVIVDGAGKIQLINAQTERVFGYSRVDLIGQDVEMLLPDRFRKSHVADRQSYSRSPHPRSMGADLDLYGRRKDGTEFPVEVSLSPLETEQGVLVSSAIRDVTTRRLAEQQIKKLNLDLSEKLTELEAANKELEAFSYSVSHDLRAPLRHIDGFSRILKEDYGADFSEDATRYLDRILVAVTNMGRLIDDLLNLARIGRKEIVRRRVSVEEVFQQAMADLPPHSEERRIEWRVGTLPEADCDPGLVKLVFVNLLSNAVKFTRCRQPAVIEVGTRQVDGATIFSIRDNGVGFDPKYADKLFGVFQRLHKQEDFEGTGIGLATVQRIINRHGGKIWAESELERGTVFFFTLGPSVLPEMAKRE